MRPGDRVPSGSIVPMARVVLFSWSPCWCKGFAETAGAARAHGPGLHGSRVLAICDSARWRRSSGCSSLLRAPRVGRRHRCQRRGESAEKFQSRWLLAPSDPASRPVGILPAPDMGPFPPNLPPMDQTSFVVDNSAPARILASAAVKSRPHTQFPQPDTLTRANDSRAPSAGSPSCAATRPWP